MASTLIDERVVERLIVATLMSAVGSSMTVLAPGEGPPETGASGSTAWCWMIGCSSQYDRMSTGGTTPDIARFTAHLVLCVPDAAMRANTYRMAEMVPLVRSALRETCPMGGGSDANHKVEYDAFRSQIEAPPEQSPRSQWRRIEVDFTVTRTSGSTLESGAS